MCEEGLKIFPVAEIRAKSARFEGSLTFNPYNLPPTIWYSIRETEENIHPKHITCERHNRLERKKAGH